MNKNSEKYIQFAADTSIEEKGTARSMSTMTHLTEPTFASGRHVLWHYKPRGGYGAIIPVPAVVIRPTAQRIRIKVRNKAGVIKEIAVHPESLVIRE